MPGRSALPSVTSRVNVVVVAAATGVVVLPLMRGGFPQGHDWIFELLRVAQYGAAFREGQWFPAWAPDLYGGYGSPIFLFYAPLFAALASLSSALLGSVTGGASLTLSGFLLAGAFGVHALVRTALADDSPAAAAAARCAAAFFVLHPYLIGDALLRNANAETAGLCLLALPLRGVLLADRRPLASFLLVSIGLAGLILAHNLTALAGFGLVLALWGWQGARLRHPASTARTALAIGLGLALAAGFWVPAFFSTELVRPEELTTGKFDFRRQFPSPGELLGYGRFFGAGWLHGGVVAALAAVAIGTRRQRGSELGLLIGALAAAVALFGGMTRASVAVWEVVPLLSLLQFPWRLLGPSALLLALALGLGFARATRGLAPAALLAAEGLVLLLCLGNALPRLGDYRPLGPAERAGLERLLDPPTLRAAARRATVRDEYLPRTALRQTFAPEARRPIVAVVPSGAARVTAGGGSRLEISVESSAPARVELGRFAFPGWRATVDGAAHPVGTSALGRVAVEVPAGRHELRVRYAAPPLRALGIAISLLGLSGIVCLGLLRPVAVWRTP